MKNLYIVALLSVSLLTLQLYSSEQEIDEYSQWKQIHKKLYSGIEDSYRKQIFHQNLQIVNDHNTRYNQGLETFQIETNQFADLTFDEFSSLYLYSSYPDKDIVNKKQEKNTSKQTIRADVPDNHDWSTIEDYSESYSQGRCLGSWAFAVAGSIEIARYDGSYQQISAQRLINCVPQVNSCLEGSVKNTWDWVTTNTNYIDLEESLKYTGTKGACTQSKDNIQMLNGYEFHEADFFNTEKEYYQVIAEYAVVSPISVSNIYFQLYKTGVYNIACDDKQDLNYDALVVGYDARTDQVQKPFYKIKMSWSSRYGENGYVKIGMESKCVNKKQSYPNR